MQKTKVAINGFGRIGRCVARILLNSSDFELVGINCSWDKDNLKYLFKYDSVHGRYEKNVKIEDEFLIVNNHKIKIFNTRDLESLDFASVGAEIVFECTGAFLTTQKCEPYLKNGIKKVLLSAPAKDDTPTFVMGVNDDKYNGENIISNASCTTNCLAPLCKVLEKEFGIKKALMNTIHAYTASQEVVDTKCAKDIRRGRAAACNLVPTSTGAAKAIFKVLPSMKDKIDGQSVRVPLADISMVDLTAVLEKDVDKDTIIKAFDEASKSYLSGMLEVDYEKRVSSDFIGSGYGSIMAADLVQVVDKNMVKILAWYDNEWGYSNQLVNLARVARKSF